MSHAHRADKLLIKPAAGARPAPPRARTDHSEGTHMAASPLTSHTRHGEHQAGNGPRQTTSRVLPSPERRRDASGIRLALARLGVERQHE